LSVVNQQITSGKAGTVVYSSADTLLALGANVALLISFRLSSMSILGLSIGLGVSDKTAWASGLAFDLFINGQRKLTITDELCTLLQKEFFPMYPPANALVELFATSQHATNIDVAAFIRAES